MRDVLAWRQGNVGLGMGRGVARPRLLCLPTAGKYMYAVEDAKYRR